MNPNENLIHNFYTCFKNKDFKGMQECYADNATFNDSVFKNLNAREVRGMWAMLISGSKDIRIEFSHINAGENTGTAEWVAYYTFSATGNKVINRINASFVFKDGKIAEHRDSFNFYKWARQALGLPGLLLGWTPLIKNKIQKKAANNLQAYLAAH